MQNTTQQSNYNDEIDLFELFETIWQGKWLIIAITMLGIILAGAYAFTAKEQWTSQAQVRIPEEKQLESYLNIETAYHRYAMLGTSPSINESLNEAFNTFKLDLFYATDEKLTALKNSIYYKTQAESLVDEQERTRLLVNIASTNFNISEINKNNIYNVRFSAETPLDAQKTLTGIIEHVNRETLKVLYERQEKRILNRIHALEAQSLRIKENTDQEHNNKLLRLEQALQTSIEAGITDYADNNPTMSNSIIELKNSEMLFMIGMLEHVNRESLKLLYERQEKSMLNRILALEAQNLRKKENTEQEHNSKLMRLEHALQNSLEAGIHDSTDNNLIIGNSIIDLKNSEMLFMLGEKNLKAQLNTLSNSPIIYPSRYYETLRNKERLKELLKPEIKGQMFSYNQTPQLPLTKDKPRKALILILGALLGGVVGTLYVLLRSALKNRRKTQQA